MTDAQAPVKNAYPADAEDMLGESAMGTRRPNKTKLLLMMVAAAICLLLYVVIAASMLDEPGPQGTWSSMTGVFRLTGMLVAIAAVLALLWGVASRGPLTINLQWVLVFTLGMLMVEPHWAVALAMAGVAAVLAAVFVYTYSRAV